MRTVDRCEIDRHRPRGQPRGVAGRAPATTSPGCRPGRTRGSAGMLTDDEIRAAFDALLPRRTPGMRTSAMGAGSDDLEAGRAYLAGAAEGGWAVPRWSKPHGGREASGAEAQAIARVAREYAVPDLY